MNTAQAVTSALAVFPPWVGIPLGVAVGILGAIQIGLIASQQMPEYASGGQASPGMALVGEQGPEIVAFNRPAQVYSNADSEKLFNKGREMNVNFYGDINNETDIDRMLAMMATRLNSALRGAA